MNTHLEHRLTHLEKEHVQLDKRIDGLEATGVFDDTVLEVLKKQRLHIKDEIVKIKLKMAYDTGANESD